ncbi:NUDIX hydrolase [Pusillimonas sp. CC-YST705]|uniref:GDP-mannose pyrophosphatase n=1 Tax=Mesopusillimonas faecipullorum TaxID=2755040 RepID=A0ABS8C9L1_9BURK|nr:NUDIX hydrolase [Mesopusillimonas faecipullorum]MCB5362715.1 NUDIX hydrolase [Mesopusillimonas faecipullorum]
MTQHSSKTEAQSFDPATHLIETPIKSEVVYQGNFLSLNRDVARQADGREVSYEYVRHPGAVVVIPMLDDGRVIVERQFRYAVGRVMTEFPAGKMNPEEEPLVCGRRELWEETGYTATEWAKAGALHLAIGYSNEIIHIYFARGLQAGERALDAGEQLDVHAVAVDDLLRASQEGELTDAKTLTCLLWLQNVRQGVWKLDWQRC